MVQVFELQVANMNQQACWVPLLQLVSNLVVGVYDKVGKMFKYSPFYIHFERNYFGGSGKGTFGVPQTPLIFT